jgi:hypothetical protein
MLLMLLLSLLVPIGWFSCCGHCTRSLMNQIQHGVARLLSALLAMAIHMHLRKPPHRYWRKAPTEIQGAAGTIYHTRRAKSTWVKHEVLRLKALMPHSGCRKIADSFNRRFACTHKMTVGKTYVSDTLRQHHYEIALLRRKIKNAKPKSVPHNLIWALDLTGKTTLDGRSHMILGIVEHASRAALALEALHSKSSWALAGKLAAAIRCYGKPRFVRTDNEAVFTSRVSRRTVHARPATRPPI